MKIYSAAYENQKCSYGLHVHPEANLFLTYYYQRRCDDCLPDLKPLGHEGIITIDSGAHSFFEQMGVSATAKHKKKGKKADKDPEEYFANYLKWLKANVDYFDFFVELDLQEIVSQQRVREWRHILHEEGLAQKCITVHHSFNNDEEYQELLETTKSGYIGLEGIRPGRPMLPYNKFLRQAYDAGVKVHGFAFTRADLLYDFPFYSVDSSSWTACIRYGVFQMFLQGRMKSVAPVKKHFLKYGPPLFMHNSFRTHDDSRVKLEWNIDQYRVLEGYFTELWEYRGINWEKKIATRELLLNAK